MLLAYDPRGQRGKVAEKKGDNTMALRVTPLARTTTATSISHLRHVSYKDQTVLLQGPNRSPTRTKQFSYKDQTDLRQVSYKDQTVLLQGPNSSPTRTKQFSYQDQTVLLPGPNRPPSVLLRRPNRPQPVPLQLFWSISLRDFSAFFLAFFLDCELSVITGICSLKLYFAS